MKILVKSAWGSDDPTKSAFAFLHANALVEAGHEAQIGLEASVQQEMAQSRDFMEGVTAFVQKREASLRLSSPN